VDYQKLYQEKKISPLEAVGLIRDNDIIASGFCGEEPFTFLSHLKAIKDNVKNVKVYTGLTLGKYDFLYDPSYKGHIDTVSPFYGPHNRNAHKLGLSSVIPGHLHSVTRRFESSHHIRVLCCGATPMDQFGYFKMSLSCVIEKTLLETVDLLILEVNPNFPDVCGDTIVHISDVDYLMEVNTPVPVLPRSIIGPEEQAIGAHVASLIHDGDTIQLGIGSIPDAAALAFKGKKDLGVHTEMITSTMADLVEEGVITNKRKSYYQGKMIGAFVFGDEKLYRFIDRNPSVLLMDSEFVNDPCEIAKNDNMVSVNTSMAVDLTGQVASEAIATMQYSGTGGQNDTAEGAIHAKNGRSIIALKSTARDGTVSAISACLTEGSIVTMSRNNIDYIVTEYGIARMKGMTVEERASALIGIAHPKFREQLLADAKKYQFL
jgi:acyl-CoA hydrolase